MSWERWELGNGCIGFLPYSLHFSMDLKFSIIRKAVVASSAENTSKEEHWSQRKQPAEGQSERAGRRPGQEEAGGELSHCLRVQVRRVGTSVINSLFPITLTAGRHLMRCHPIFKV